MQECRNAGMQECRNTRIQEYKNSGILAGPLALLAMPKLVSAQLYAEQNNEGWSVIEWD